MRNNRQGGADGVVNEMLDVEALATIRYAFEARLNCGRGHLHQIDKWKRV